MGADLVSDDEDDFEVDSKIHSYLIRSLDDRRRQIIARQAEAALRLEWVDERIEEREYDEQERLRVDRIVNRRIFRGEAHQRYSVLVNELKGKEGAGTDQISALRTQLATDLNAVAAAVKPDGSVVGSLQSYSNIIPPEHWPVILCMSHASEGIGNLKKRLVSHGFNLVNDEGLERFGILKLPCPPEMTFLRRIAGLSETSAIADTLTPIAIPEPMAVGSNMVESRHILGITDEMRAELGCDITLAVLDTGLDRNHPAFVRVAREDYRDFTGTGADDINGHGTHCAAIAAGDDSTKDGKYAGIAPRCRLIAGKVLVPGVAGNLETILQGMSWAVHEKKADILSLSLGDSSTPANGRSIWTRACDEAFRNGTVVCIAAGNPMPSYPDSVGVPADATTAVTVGAINKDRHLAPFSAMGSMNPGSPLYGKPNCVGPGVDIVAARSTAAHFDRSEVVDALHVRLSGTSMATPAIAGCMALLKSKARALGWDISAAELIALFYSACRPVQDPHGERYSEILQVGHGLVNMEEACQAAGKQAPARHARAANATTAAPATAAGLHTLDEDEDFEVESAPGRTAQSVKEFQPGVCYRCGKHYLSKLGVFSPAWECPECGAPICQICWQVGDHTCEKHKESAAAASDPDDKAPALRTEDLIPGVARAGAISKETARGISTMSTTDSDSQQISGAPSPHWGETFLNRFDLKIRHIGQVTQPWSGEAFAVDPKIQSQAFRRKFGDVAQYPLSSGLLVKERFLLAAIRLDPSALESTGNILQQIAGQEGLDFQDKACYCVGIFSPTGWPEEWRNHAEARGNAMFYFVEKGEGTSWIVSGPKSPLRDLYDPESRNEKKARAEKALAHHTRLVVPGDQIALETFLTEQQLDRESAVAAIETSGGRFQILEHKGKSYIQKSTR
jgi:subtilisin family serine protease